MDRSAGAFELFGPANVGVWRASFAVEAGNAEAALRYAAAVEPRALASRNRRAALGIEKARALAMLGKEGDAITELRHAGITRQMIPAQRPQRQLPACTKYFGPTTLIGRTCTFQWLWIGVGWLQARTIEASYTLLYALLNGGNCPPGMPACI